MKEFTIVLFIPFFNRHLLSADYISGTEGTKLYKTGSAALTGLRVAGGTKMFWPNYSHSQVL